MSWDFSILASVVKEEGQDESDSAMYVCVKQGDSESSVVSVMF